MLVERLSQVDFGGRQFEVILVDDNSQDGIVEVVKQEQRRHPWLKLVVRNEKNDLSQSILRGFQEAKYPILITMDADLSHPAEKIPTMLDMLSQANVDLVIGSRYVPGGSSDEKWPLYRKMISRGAAGAARVLLLSKVKDPLSGFIAIRKKKCFSGATLSPIGWKVGLEIIVKSRCQTIREVPIHFSQRHHGTSKLNWKIAFDYLRHLMVLAHYRLFQ
jgi:dolichol-phosphate mannosyltransferase